MKVNDILQLWFAILPNGWRLKQYLTRMDLKLELSFMSYFAGNTYPVVNNLLLTFAKCFIFDSFPVHTEQNINNLYNFCF